MELYVVQSVTPIYQLATSHREANERQYNLRSRTHSIVFNKQ